jgi:DNA-binding CsgD family transcriptional regulator
VNSRINVVDLPWGSHLCLFYETIRDLLDILVPYFKAGLENDESCLWVIPEPETVEAARIELQRHIPDIDRHLNDGTIEIHLQQEWYLKGGGWNLERGIERIHEKLRQALARGYIGLRVNGSSAWLQRERPDAFRTYETALDAAVAGQPLIVLCTFPLMQATATDLLDVAESHLFVGAMRNGRCQILETPELRLAKREISTLSSELVDAVKKGALRPFPHSEAAASLLTPREREVLGWVAQGKSAWEIGQILNIAKRTVDEHVANAIKKLNAVNRVQAIAIAVRDGIIQL